MLEPELLSFAFILQHIAVQSTFARCCSSIVLYFKSKTVLFKCEISASSKLLQAFIMSDETKTPLLHTRRDQKSTWSGENAAPDSPPTNGTIMSSSINLAACALGASMLSLPYTMKISGPVISIEFLIIFGIMAFIAAQSIVRAGLHARRSSYSAIVYDFFGFFPGLFVDILLCTALLVAAISYIVGISELLPVRILLRI